MRNNVQITHFSLCKFAADDADAFDHILQLLSSCPTAGLTEAAIRGESKLFGRRKLKTAADAFSDIFGCLDVRAFHVNNADGNVMSFGDFADNFDLSEFAACHFDMDF